MKKGNPLSADVLTSLFRTSPKDPLRIVNREGTTIEFKKSYNHAGMAQYFKTIVTRYLPLYFPGRPYGDTEAQSLDFSFHKCKLFE